MIDARTHRQPRVGFVLATLAIDALGFGIVVPVVPNLVLRLSDLPPSAAAVWTGALLAAFSAMQFLCAPLLGALSDRYGRRPVLLLSLSGVCANYLMLAWAPSLPWLFVGRLIAGATAANVSAATAYIADVTPPAQRAQRFGLVGAMFGLGFVLGPAVGGLLGAYGLRLPFLAAAALAGLNVLYGIFVLPESLPPERRRAFAWRRANPVGTLGAVAADPTYLRLAVAWCSAWFAIGALQSSFVLANDLRLGWGTWQNGMALATIGFGSALVQGLLVRRLVPWLGERRAALLGYVLAAAAYLLFAFAVRGWILYAGIAMQALGAVSGPAVQAMVSARAGPDRQGEVQGSLASLQGLTAIVSPLVAGWLFGVFAPRGLPGAPFLLAALTYGAAFMAVRGLRGPSGRREAAVGLQEG
jgi:DHA1 family tetracycline resistance protein-like MFS transporter